MRTKLDLADVPSQSRGDVRFDEGEAIDQHIAVGDGDPFSGQPDDTLDEHRLSAGHVDRDDVSARRGPSKVCHAREPKPGARIDGRLHADAVPRTGLITYCEVSNSVSAMSSARINVALSERPTTNLCHAIAQ